MSKKYSPIEPVIFGFKKDTVNIFARKYNSEVVNIYDALNDLDKSVTENTSSSSNGYNMYKNVKEMVTDSTLKKGENVFTAGYYQPGDGGAASYLITDDNTKKPWDIAIANGLYAEISEKEKVNYKQFGAYLDGIQDDGPAMILCHKYADSIYNYDVNGLVKQYLCKVENHQGVIYKKGTDAISCCSDVDLSGSTLLVDDNNAAWFGIYVWGDNNSLFYDYELSDDVKVSFEADNFVLKMASGDALPPNTVLKIEEDPYSARDDAGYLYTVARRELIVHDADGICSLPLTDDWSNAGGEEINCQISDLVNGGSTTVQSFTTLKASYTYIPARHGTFTGCDVKLEMSAAKYCTVMWCKRHNATVQNFIFRPKNTELHNTKFKNTMIYIWDSYNVTVKNLQGFNAAGKMNGTINGTSGYLLRLTNCADVHIEDCRMQGYWGCTAMDSVKNIFFKRCHMNRLDIHDYFSNLFAEDCTFYNHAIQIGYGRGLVAVNNCRFLFNKIPLDSYPSSHMIEFNLTYGRLFEGKIQVANCQIITHDPVDDEFNLFKLEFSPSATAITKHLRFPEITVKDIYIHTNKPAIHYAFFKVTGIRRGTTASTKPSHVYGLSNDGTVTWTYYGRGVNWGEDITEIALDSILRVSDSFLDLDSKTQFYNKRFYICTKAGTLDFAGDKPKNMDGSEFTCGTATLKYYPDVLWKSKHVYSVGDLCAASPSEFYPLYLFKCTTAGTSNGYFPTHTSGTILDGVNDSVNEPDDCWWTYVGVKASWCIDWTKNLTVSFGQRILAEGRIYEVVADGILDVYPPYDTTWFGNSSCGTAILKYIGAKWKQHAWYAKDSYCEARGNIYQLAKHDGTTSGVLPTRGNPYCVDGDIIWQYLSGGTGGGSGGIAGTLWVASTQYDSNAVIQSGTHLYTVQNGVSGSSAPTATSGIVMDGTIPVKCLGEHALIWRTAGASYVVGDIIIDNTFVVQCITAGTTAKENKWGPVEGAAWTADGTFADGTCVWKKITESSGDGVWRDSSTPYAVGTAFIVDGSISGTVRLYQSLAGTSGTNMPVDTSGNTFINGTLPLKYVGESSSNGSNTGADSWLPNHAYNNGDTIVSNSNTYKCVFDGRLTLPNKTIFENITTNIESGHIFWFYKGTDIPTSKGDREWKIIAKNCEGIDETPEGITGTTPYFCHSNNINPTVTVS